MIVPLVCFIISPTEIDAPIDIAANALCPVICPFSLIASYSQRKHILGYPLPLLA